MSCARSARGGMTRTKSCGLDPAWNHKYLREVPDKTPAGSTRKRTLSRSYQDTKGDLKVDRLTETVTEPARPESRNRR